MSGGRKYNGRMVPFLFAYDPALDQWARRQDLPYRSSNGVTGVYKNRLYVLAYCSGIGPDGSWAAEGVCVHLSPRQER